MFISALRDARWKSVIWVAPNKLEHWTHSEPFSSLGRNWELEFSVPIIWYYATGRILVTEYLKFSCQHQCGWFPAYLRYRSFLTSGFLINEIYLWIFQSVSSLREGMSRPSNSTIFLVSLPLTEWFWGGKEIRDEKCLALGTAHISQ